MERGGQIGDELRKDYKFGMQEAIINFSRHFKVATKN